METTTRQTTRQAMPQNLSAELQGYVTRLQERQDALRKKFDTKGFVVAGFGGDTYYAFVGAGRGFAGAALLPTSTHPYIFDTREAASRAAENGTYRNGRGDVIRLSVEDAANYFQKVYGIFEKSIAIIRDRYNN